MNAKTILIFLSCFVFSLSLDAQLKKGDWRLGGEISFLDQQSNTNGGAFTTVVLNPEIAVMLTDKWMLGGNLNINFFDEQTRVSQSLFFRHYFKSWGPTYLFWGGEVEWEKFRIISTGGAGPSIRFFRSNLELGAQHFLNKNTALEILADYRWIQMTAIPGRDVREVINRGIELSASLKLFFPTQLTKDTLKETIQFRKGQWALGGRISLAEEGNQLEPEALRFFSRQWALGVRFNYADDFALRSFDVGLDLLARYYLNLGRKKKLFGELASGYRLKMIRVGNEWRMRDRKLVYGLALGLTNMLSEYASFDLIFFYEQDDPVFDTNPLLAFQRMGFKIGLQTYIGGR